MRWIWWIAIGLALLLLIFAAIAVSNVMHFLHTAN
jgi:hypothetical protein